MARVVYPSLLRIPCPWHLTKADLGSLHELLEGEWQKLRTLRQDRIDALVRKEKSAEVRRENKRLQEWGKEKLTTPAKEVIGKRIRDRLEASTYEFRSNREVVVHTESGKSFHLETLEELLRTTDVQSEAVKSFRIGMNCADVTVSVELTRYQGLVLGANPGDNQDALAIYQALSHWSKERAASRWIRMWLEFSGLQWYLWLAACLLTLLFATVTHILDPGSSPMLPDVIRTAELLDKGIQSEEDERAALKLLLAHATRVPSDWKAQQVVGRTKPNERAMAVPMWFWIMLVGGPLICLAIGRTPPAVIVGLGDGDERIKKWRTWSKVVTIIVPAYLATMVAEQVLKKLLGI